MSPKKRHTNNYLWRIALSSRLVFFFFAVIALRTTFIPEKLGYLASQNYPDFPNWVVLWANFDGRHFIDIATFNYRNFNFVYFPLYPALIRFQVELLHIPILYSGIIISLFTFFGGIYVFNKLLAIDWKKNKLPIFLLSIFPTAFYFQSIYSESCFFLFSVSSMYFAREKKWALAGLFGLATTLTRLTGIAIIPALAAEWYIQNRRNIDWRNSFIRSLFPALFLSSLSIGLYYLYLHINYGDGLLFMKSFSAWHREELTFPLQVIYRYMKIFIVVPKNQFELWVAVLEFVVFALFTALTYITGKYIRFSYAIWMGGIILLSSLSGSFIGMPRYALHMWPGFIGLAYLLDGRTKLKYIVVFSFLVLGFFLTSLFTKGYFIS